MKAPPALRSLIPDVYRPPYGKGDLDTRRAFRVGSGNAGAGGRLLVASNGRLLLGGDGTLPFIQGKMLMKAVECDLTSERFDTFLIENAELKGIQQGDWNTDASNDWPMTCGRTEHYEAAGLQESTVGKPSLPTAKVLALWNALAAHPAPTPPGGDLRPEKATEALTTTWERWHGVYDRFTASATEATGLSLRYYDLRPGSAGGLGQLLAEQSVTRRRSIPGFLFGHYGRRDASPHFTLKGTLCRNTATGKTVAATLRLYCADTAPEDFLSQGETRTVPQWRLLYEKPLLFDPDAPEPGAFAFPIRLRGATVHLLTLEIDLRPEDANAEENVPEIPPHYTDGYDNWTDEDGNLVGDWRATKRTTAEASITLDSLYFLPRDPNKTKAPGKAEG